MVMLALGPVPDSYTGPEVLCGIGALSQKIVQNCGRAFFDRYEKIHDEIPTSQDSSQAGSSKATSDKPVADNKKQQRRGNVMKLSDELKGVDLYELLGVAPSATDEDLRKAFRAKSLLMHPDKHGDKPESEQKKIQDKFVQLQETYEMLCDTAMRRKYDSLQEFDDSIPSKTDAKSCETFEEFYDLFAPVFERNAKWSVKKAPRLPADKADFEKEVRPFYKFWLSFESWRDMDAKIIEDQGDDAFCDLNEAECREEKRWMERENGRIRQKYINEEYGRILELTQLAEKFDPRMKAMRDEQMARKNRGKLAKEAAAQEAREKEERERIERERVEKEEQERRAQEKAKREEAKMRIKKIRQDLRTIARHCAHVCMDQFQDLLLKMDNEQLESFLDKLTAAKEADRLEETRSTFHQFGMVPLDPKPATPSTTVGEGSDAEEIEEDAGKRRKNKKKAKKDNGTPPRVESAAEIRRKAAEEAQRAAEKLIRDEKRAKQEEKKAAEKLRKQQARAEREAEEAAKATEAAAEKARIERARVAEEAERQRAEALLSKQQAEQEREDEMRSVRFSAHRQRLLDSLGDNVPGDAKRIASSFALLGAVLHVVNEEDRLDCACALLAHRSEAWFVLGKRQCASVTGISNALRNKTKKVRQQIRDAVKDVLSTTTQCPCPDDVKSFVAGEYPMEGWESAPVKEVEETEKKTTKKKKKVVDEEDLDALLKEFDVTVTEKKKKGKK